MLWRDAVDVGSVRFSSNRTEPAQLPPDTVHFSGREDALTRLHDGYQGSHSLVITGMAGVDKTALAIRALHRLSSQFPHGVVFLDLHGFTEDAAPPPAIAAVEMALRALGIAGKQIPTEMSDRTALLREVLAQRTVLLVLDNVAHES